MRRAVAAVLIVGVLALAGAGPTRAGADDDAAANRLVVEAAGLVSQAEASEDAQARADLYRRALDKLDEIVAEHPGSEHAARLATGQPIGALDREDVERQWRLSLAEDCFRRSDRLCLLRQALEFAKKDRSPTDRADNFSDIAGLMAEGGHFVEALEIAALIDRPGDRAYALAHVALEQGLAGQETAARKTLDTAIDLTEQVRSTLDLAFALGAIGVAELQMGDRARANAFLHRARAAVATVKDTSDRVRILYVIAFDQILVDDVDGAAETVRRALSYARTINHPSARAWALGIVATIQAKAGDLSSASETLAMAKRAASEAKFGEHDYVNLSGIAAAEAALGNGMAAFRVAESVPYPLSRAYILASIAYEEHRIGDGGAAYRTGLVALEAVRRGDDPSWISTTLVTLASFL